MSGMRFERRGDEPIRDDLLIPVLATKEELLALEERVAALEVAARVREEYEAEVRERQG